jgi:hypothetical protein
MNPYTNLKCHPSTVYESNNCKVTALFPGRTEEGSTTDSAAPDMDYLIFVEGVQTSDNLGTTPGYGDFLLDVSCQDVGEEFLNPTAETDRWYIQRSAAPPAEIVMANPIKGGHWLELNSWQVNAPNNFKYLTATAYPTPTIAGLSCGEGTVNPLPEHTPSSATGFYFQNTACTPSLTVTCPEAQNGVLVEQTFEIHNPYETSLGIYSHVPNSPTGTFSFCIHTELVYDYLDPKPAMDTVSYFDTYYNSKFHPK